MPRAPAATAVTGEAKAAAAVRAAPADDASGRSRIAVPAPGRARQSATRLRAPAAAPPRADGSTGARSRVAPWGPPRPAVPSAAGPSARWRRPLLRVRKREARIPRRRHSMAPVRASAGLAPPARSARRRWPPHGALAPAGAGGAADLARREELAGRADDAAAAKARARLPRPAAPPSAGAPAGVLRPKTSREPARPEGTAASLPEPGCPRRCAATRAADRAGRRLPPLPSDSL